MAEWQSTTFTGLLAILDSPRWTVLKTCQAIEDCISANNDNLRAFFEQCLPTIVKRLFGYDGQSWLNTVAKSPKEADARALLRLLSPTGVLFTAMYNADADGSTQFVFPKERLPTHTQMMLATPTGLQELDTHWPQYASAIVCDAAGRPHIHLGVFQYFMCWFAFYVLKGDGGAGMDSALRPGGGGLSSSVRKAADALHLSRAGGRESEALRHPYLAALRQFLLELVPRPAGGLATGTLPSPVKQRASANPLFSAPRRQGGSATRGQIFYSTLLEFWLTDGDEPVPVGSTAVLASRSIAAPPPRSSALAPIWSTTYEPPSEDLLEALTEFIKYITVTGSSKLQPAQGTTVWLPPTRMLTLAQPAGHHNPPAAPGPMRLGAVAQPEAQAFARRVYRFFHRAFSMWPEQRTIKPLLRCFLAYLAPWNAGSSAPVLAPGAYSSAPGHSQLTAQLTAKVSDLAQRVHWPDAVAGGGSGTRGPGVPAGGYGPAWEPWVLSNLPFYSLLLPLFLDMSIARVEMRGESAVQDLVGVFGVLEAAPELRDLLAQVERDLGKYAASQPRRPDGPYAELLPWLLDQAHDWEVAATANAVGDSPAARAPPMPHLFSTAEPGAAAAVARGLLELSAQICKPEAQTRLRRCLESVLPLAALPASGEAEAARAGQDQDLDADVPRLPKSSWCEVRYKGDPLTRPITSFELGFLVRLLVALSMRLNAGLGLDRPWTDEEEPPENRLQELLARLRRRGWRINLRPLADLRTLFWLPVALVCCLALVRVLAWVAWLLAHPPPPSSQQRQQHLQQRQPRHHSLEGL